ncbi:MAG: 50S ribosomal protein L29 [Alphaproteobacteria bacterium]
MSKAKKTEDFKAKTVDELQKSLLDARKTQMNLRFQRTGGQLEKTSEIRKTRRDIARIKTFINQKQSGVDATPAKPKAVKAAAPAKKAKAKKDEA